MKPANDVAERIPTLLHYAEKDTNPAVVEGHYDENTQLWVTSARMSSTHKTTTMQTNISPTTTQADEDKKDD